MRFLPAEPDSGITVILNEGDSPPAPIACDVLNLDERGRHTVLANWQASVETVEHVLSAVAGLGIDNLTMHVDAGEMPSIDGSSLPFVEALRGAGLQDQDVPRDVFVIDEPVMVSDEGASLAALPGPADALEIRNSVLFSQDGSALYLGGLATLATSDVMANDFFSNTSILNLSDDTSDFDISNLFVDPEFVDYQGNAQTNDFHLAGGSPLIDAGDPDPAWNDTDTSRSDMGCFGGPIPLP